MYRGFAHPLIADNWFTKKIDSFYFEMFNFAVFQENFKVKGGELKTIVDNDIVMAKNI